MIVLRILILCPIPASDYPLAVEVSVDISRANIYRTLQCKLGKMYRFSHELKPRRSKQSFDDKHFSTRSCMGARLEWNALYWVSNILSFNILW